MDESSKRVAMQLDAERAQMFGDAPMLQNALLNLGLNGRYAMPIRAVFYDPKAIGCGDGAGFGIRHRKRTSWDC